MDGWQALLLILVLTVLLSPIARWLDKRFGPGNRR
jgi:predicted PurR-regulated permease PerM